MDRVIKTIFKEDLTGQNVDVLTNGNCPVHLYKDLPKYRHIREVIGPHNACIVLFPVKSSSSGHWVAILYFEDTNTVHFFDPYGLSWNQELQYSEDPITRQNLIGKFMQDAKLRGYNTTWNSYRYQKMETGINTCGRQSAIRCRFRYLHEDEYKRLMTNQTNDPDFIVTMLSFITIDHESAKGIVKNIVSK